MLLIVEVIADTGASPTTSSFRDVKILEIKFLLKSDLRFFELTVGSYESVLLPLPLKVVTARTTGFWTVLNELCRERGRS